jgi:glyoxylase-like metal-dependent hydrolase (beta-lactamase superfamily II)/8-oxo-dGTP pyrophosphatase MutT (NUDIX family)
VVVLYRRAAEGVEVFWLEREQRLAFAGGFYAFPGGRLDAADGAVPVEGAEGEEAKQRVAAARELFEEAGVLRAVGAERLTQTRLDELRRALLDGARAFGELLAAEGLSLRAEDFTPAGRWVTPPYLPGGFDARFFLVEAPAGQLACVWPGELAAGEWIAPAEALRRWEAGDALLHPPNLHAVSVMAHFSGHAEAAAALAAPPHCRDFVSERIEFQRGVLLCPLVTPTLPPATHTNAYVLGTGDCVLVDPGAPDAAEAERLVALVRQLASEGYRPRAVVLTHHHGDHVGGAGHVAAALRLPVWAHAEAASRLPVSTGRLLEDGEVLELDGPLPMRWRVLHTPGHARGHVCLVDEASRAVIAGDMVAGVGTIVIDPPEGDMAEYLRQLARLEALPVRAIYPAHGPVIPAGPAKLREYQAHRAWREAKVLEALRGFGTAVTLEELVARAYDDVAAFVWPIAQRNTDAIVRKLEAEGRVAREGERVRVA